MIDFVEIDKEFIISIDSGFYPLVIYKKSSGLTFPKTLSVSEAFERAKQTGEEFDSVGTLSGAKLLKLLNDELGREIDSYMNIAILNYNTEVPVVYSGNDENVKQATHLANVILGFSENELQDNIDTVGESSTWLEHAQSWIKAAQNR